MSKTTTNPNEKDPLESVAENLSSLGRAWAKHGLTVGRSALETTAETLRVTAEALATFSSKLETVQEEPPSSQPDPGQPNSAQDDATRGETAPK